MLEPDPASRTSGGRSSALTGIVTGQGPSADVDAIDDFVAAEAVRRELGDAGLAAGGARPGRDRSPALEPRTGPERLLDLLLRAGPYGDRFGEDPDGFTLERLEEAPHGIDLGPLEPRLPGSLRTPSGKVELAPGADPRRPSPPARGA